MDAYNLYKGIFFKYIERYAAFSGVNLMQPGYKPSVLTYFWITINSTMMVSGIYTIIFYGSDMAWKNLTVIGLTFQGLVKYVAMISNSEILAKKVQFLGIVYKHNRFPNTPNAKVLQKWAEGLHFFVKYGFLAVGMPLSIFVVYPMWVYFRNGELQMILPILIPGLDSNTRVGFIGTSALHLAGCALAIVGTCGADFMLVVIVVHMWPLCDVFDNMVQELNETLMVDSNQNTIELKVYFRNVTMIHSEICKYLKEISDVYFFMIFCEVFTCAESMCTVLYCIKYMEWIQSYFLLSVMFVTLFAYCALGTVAETATDRIYMTLMNSEWRLLPRPLRHHFGLMIARAQNPTILMAGTMPLNLDTFVRVMKTVYSVGMVLARTGQ